MNNNPIREICPRGNRRTDHAGGAWCSPVGQNKTIIAIAEVGHEVLDINRGDRVSIFEMEDGRFQLKKTAHGRKLVYAGRSKTGRATFPMGCIRSVATIEDGDIYFPAGIFIEGKSK